MKKLKIQKAWIKEVEDYLVVDETEKVIEKFRNKNSALDFVERNNHIYLNQLKIKKK